jgi:membrane protease subunit HflC
MRWRLFLVLMVAGLALFARLCLFTVDRTEFVYLTQFGRHVETFDGADPAQAGLHLKWPWPVQSVQTLDRRLQFFDLPGSELLTRDPKRNTIDKTLTIDAYVCWRIADREGVDRFLRSVGTPAGAQAILGQRINSQLGAVIGERELDDLISDKPRRVEDARKEIRQKLMEVSNNGGPSLVAAAEAEYGIKVVDVRLRRFNHPPAVREAIFERIRSERQKKVADYQSEGERLAADIKSAGERRVSELKSQAEAEALRLRGQAEAEADRIRNEAARQDPQFYAFLKKLEDYRRILGDNKSVLLLSTHREMFDALFNPPVPVSPAPPVANAPGSPAPPATSKRGGP